MQPTRVIVLRDTAEAYPRVSKSSWLRAPATTISEAPDAKAPGAFCCPEPTPRKRAWKRFGGNGGAIRVVAPAPGLIAHSVRARAAEGWVGDGALAWLKGTVRTPAPPIDKDALVASQLERSPSARVSQAGSRHPVHRPRSTSLSFDTVKDSSALR